MRISTITNWAYGLTLLLTAASASAFIYASAAASRERAAVAEHLEFDQIAEQMVDGAEELTDQARLYVVRREDRHLSAYRHEADVVRQRDLAIQRARRMDPAPAELAALAEAERDLPDLTRIEETAVAAASAGRWADAEAALFGPQHERAQAAVVGALNHFDELVGARTQLQMQEAKRDSDAASLVAKTMLLITAVLFLGVLYFVLRRRVVRPLVRMTGIVTRLAHQDYEVEVPVDRRDDEIGEMTQAIHVFRDNGLERDRLELARMADQQATDGILHMTHRLQGCENHDELIGVVTCFAPQIFPALAGALYVFDDARNALVLTRTWLEPTSPVDSFPPVACWGVRRGRTHESHSANAEVPCPHLTQSAGPSLCIPLIGQGETIGLLWIEERAEARGAAGEARGFLKLMAENIALALANLRLRERLASLAERDGLTGLYNRRCLEEALARAAEATACVMVDIDHFKRFNDAFGHDAGDAVMQHVAQLMAEAAEGVGKAYRFGGEEFTLLLPELDVAQAFEVAERLRTAVAAAPLAHHGRMLGHITISLGLAASPEHGPAAALMQQADAALLEAKTTGRNRTLIATVASTPRRRRGVGGRKT